MAKTVAELCQQHDITLEQLTERSGLDSSRVVAIAAGRWTPSPRERQQVATVFNVSVEEIAWGHKTPIQHLYGHGPG